MLDNTPVLGRSSDLNAQQHKVLRNTYALLGATMIPTIIGAFIGLQLNFSFMAQHPFMFFIGFMAVMMGMFKLIAANANSSMGVWLLLGLTFVFGLLLGPILQHALHLSNGPQIIGLAAAGTGISFLSLAAIGSSPARDFSGMGKMLMIGLVLVILASLANMFFKIPALSLAISAISVLIFSAYILYDVNQIVRGGQTNYVMAATNLYLDVYNLFTHLLQLLMSFMGGDD